MQLYLIRHGKTSANEKHLYCGSTDLALSESGIAELSKIHYDVPAGCRFLTSGMLRTRQTLRFLFGDVEYEVDRRFREMEFGEFEMHSYEELKENSAYQDWISGDNESNICPGGESGVQMKQRVLEAFSELWKRGEDTVLVAHGGTIAIIMEHLFPEEEKNRYSWQPKPGCGYLVTDGGYEIIS